MDHPKALGGAVSNADEAWTVLVATASEAIERVYPLDWDLTVGRAYAYAPAGDKKKLTQSQAFKALLNMRLDSTILTSQRVGLVMHCLSSLGVQLCDFKKGPVISMIPYLPPLVRMHAKRLAELYNVGFASYVAAPTCFATLADVLDPTRPGDVPPKPAELGFAPVVL